MTQKQIRPTLVTGTFAYLLFKKKVPTLIYYNTCFIRDVYVSVSKKYI